MKTKRGRTLSKADLDEMAAAAEKGLDLSEWKPAKRPSSVKANTHRISVHVSPDLRERVSLRAAQEGRNLTDIIRNLLEDYGSDQGLRKSDKRP